MRFELVVEPISCHRCLGDLLLAARVPHPCLDNCIHIQPLCPRCHADDPTAQGLLAFFALYAAIDEDNASTFDQLVGQWLESVPPPRSVDPEAFERDIAAWRRGDFDHDEDHPASTDE